MSSISLRFGRLFKTHSFSDITAFFSFTRMLWTCVMWFSTVFWLKNNLSHMWQLLIGSTVILNNSLLPVLGLSSGPACQFLASGSGCYFTLFVVCSILCFKLKCSFICTLELVMNPYYLHFRWSSLTCFFISLLYMKFIWQLLQHVFSWY